MAQAIPIKKRQNDQATRLIDKLIPNVANANKKQVPTYVVFTLNFDINQLATSAPTRLPIK